MKAVTFLAALFLLLPAVAFASDIAAPPHIQQKHVEMLYPTVLVRLGGGSGSGTVIHSKQNEERAYESFMLKLRADGQLMLIFGNTTITPPPWER